MKRPWQRFAFGTAISTAVLIALSRFVGLRQIIDALRRVDVSIVLAAVLVITLANVVRGLRWWMILRRSGAKARPADTVSVYLASTALNGILPLRAGDVMRVVSFGREIRAPKSLLLGSLILERALDVVTILVFGAIILQLHPGGGWLGGLRPVILLFMAAGATSLMLVILCARPARELSRRLVGRFVKGEVAGARVESAICPVFDIFIAVGPRFAAELLAMSLFIWALEGSVYVLCARAMVDHVAVAAPWMAMVLANLSMIIPSAPAYLGTFHASAMAGLTSYGASARSAAAFAVLVHAILWLPVIFIGLGSLIGLRAPRQAGAEADAESLLVVKAEEGDLQLAGRTRQAVNPEN